jgi:hypothetical protein
MQLTYRGTRYELSATTATKESDEVVGKYRGTLLKILTTATVSVCHMPVKLKYRGTSYQLNY